MKKIAMAMAAASALLLTTGVQAQATKSSPLYGEIGYTSLKYSGAGLSASPAALRGIVGYGLHPNFAVEGMLGFGVKNDTINVAGTSVEVKLQHMYGAYVKARANPTPELELFARLGYAEARTKGTAAGVAVTSTDGDVSYGAGLNYKFTPSVYVGADYMIYYSKSGEKHKGFTLGLGMSF